LQEAYLTVDWERNNFTLGQAVHQADTLRDVVPIPPVLQEISSSGKLKTSTIAGIAVGIVAAMAIIAIAAFIAWRRKRQRRISSQSGNSHLMDEKPQLPREGAETNASQKADTELLSTPLPELHDEDVRAQLMSTPVFELAGDVVEHELAAGNASDKKFNT